MGFKPPEWASQPCREATLEVRRPGGAVDSQPIDAQPWYVIGRDASACDVVLEGGSASRQHAALVHHEDGRLFLIDLQSTHGTSVDGARVAPHKPTVMKDGAVLRFGGQDAAEYVVRCESSAEKRRGDATGEQHDHKRAASGGGGGGGGAGGPAQVRASHLLVKHCGSRRPASWKEDPVTRSPGEALALIEAFRSQLVAGQPSPDDLAHRFAELAAVESHCNSAKRGGDLGFFGRGQMQPSFEGPAFALAVGELSGPVESDSGVHLILRTG
ncbi:hypothetical protein Rsub_10993 [Raphidocelis subcapitata]|uniref:Peptidyl-prolyl cis-trans isomerase n=1 Tax=Raphidocelis subcapitata TaxID=307507 RepID=A0A2V0PBX3_9CHLO|nr:hypothetical protein Rsub_10993 [Raphidocelis subcapitata]|eukprot:GBF97346.1 hypothetical protein Rsub_10993 [Raphidocelis subcapitata]